MSDSEGSGDRPPDGAPSSKDAGLSGKLRDLDRRISQHRSAGLTESAKVGPKPPGFGMALRLGADFVAGVVVGAAIGWGFDWLLGTSPWGLIVFLLLGFAAGILTVMRSAGLIAGKSKWDDPMARRFDE